MDIFNFDEGFVRTKLRILGGAMFVISLIVFFGFEGVLIAMSWGLYEAFRTDE